MNEPKMTECKIFGWVSMYGDKVGACLNLGAFAPGKEMTYAEILSHTSQEQLDKFCKDTMPRQLRFTGGSGPLFNIMTPEEYEAEFGDSDDEGEDEEPDTFLGPTEPNPHEYDEEEGED